MHLDGNAQKREVGVRALNGELQIPTLLLRTSFPEPLTVNGYTETVDESSLTHYIVSRHLGDWASVLGFLVGVAGFGFTIWQLVRTRKAADAARNAAVRLRAEITRTNAVADLASVVSTLQEIKRLHRREAWEVVLDRYSSAREQIVDVRSARENLSSQDRSTLQSAMTTIAELERDVEANLEDSGRTVNVIRLNARVSILVENIQSILSRTKKQVGPDAEDG
jgi:hypothetical protein